MHSKYKLLFDAFRKGDKKVSKQIERHFQHEVATLVAKNLSEWRSAYSEPELKLRARALLKRLEYEASEYIKILSEIKADERHPDKVSPEEINKKIMEWVQGNPSVIIPVGGGVVVDLGSALATGIIAEAAFHLSIKGLAASGIGIPVAAFIAWLRKEYIQGKVRENLVKALADNRGHLLAQQKSDVRSVVEEAFKSISEPISQSIESEIAIIEASLKDVLEKRRSADFDANAYEKEARAFAADIGRRVSEIRQHP